MKLLGDRSRVFSLVDTVELFQTPSQFTFLLATYVMLDNLIVLVLLANMSVMLMAVPCKLIVAVTHLPPLTNVDHLFICFAHLGNVN